MTPLLPSTPLALYHQKISEQALLPNPDQEAAMQHLEQIYWTLLSPKKWGMMRKKQISKGLYLWGDVGGGKTQLLDLFYQSLSIPKIRLHFYTFMQNIHRALTRLQGKADPLRHVATELAQSARVICLDEFLVHEITDAMLLARLLQALFEHQIVLVITTNTAPELLYHNGLQRQLFLPAIKHIQQHLTVVHLARRIDYRASDLAPTTDGLGLARIDRTSDTSKGLSSESSIIERMSLSQLRRLFAQLSSGEMVQYQPLLIDGRPITHYGYTENTAWFNFASICSVPRSQSDYLALAERFSIVLLSDIKPIDEQEKNRIRLFMQLVDIFYDQGVTLVCTSELTNVEPYAQGCFLYEYERTKSRLIALKKQALRQLRSTDLSINASDQRYTNQSAR